MTDDEDHMVKISDLISRLQATKDQFGDTCVYIRRGGLAWGAVALNRRDDDKKHGVFDLQAQHDRDMLQRAEQAGRLIASRRSAEERLASTVTALTEIDTLATCTGVVDPTQHRNMLENIYRIARKALGGDVGGLPRG